MNSRGFRETDHAPERLHPMISMPSLTLQRLCTTLPIVNDEMSAPGTCIFCSYISRLAKYLTKHMTTKCQRCHKLTNRNQSQFPSSTSPQVPSSSLATALPVPSQSLRLPCWTKFSISSVCYAAIALHRTRWTVQIITTALH